MNLKKSYPRTIEIAESNFKVMLPELNSSYIDVDEHLAAISIHLQSQEKLQQLEKMILNAPLVLKALTDVKEWLEEMDRSSDKSHLRYIMEVINQTKQ